MSDPVIRARNLSKIYRLYTKPHHRFLDLFGLLDKADGLYTEHAALSNVSLDIGRGEKIAIIGRNGAGKSTFLKIVSKVIEPTSGVIEINERIHALLSIGTGFHPDFTGRENVYSYLAQLGVTGEEAEARVEEIIEFAELEEYIDQPTKTYSSGMGVRLMFSTSTSIEPDILILDEVLGVGDAYFANKSYERINRLCTEGGTTLLLVTHDVYSAMKICDRVIWIDQGKVLMDDVSSVVVKAYEDSIREQEERRLRKRKLLKLEGMKDVGKSRVGHVLVEIRGKGNRPQPGLIHFSRISYMLDGEPVESLPIGDGLFDETAVSHLVKDATNWGESSMFNGRLSRPLLNYGSSFHKVAGMFVAPAELFDKGSKVKLVIDYFMEEKSEFTVTIFSDGEEISLGELAGEPGKWATGVLLHTKKRDEEIEDGSVDTERLKAQSNSVNTSGVYGSGAIVIEEVKAVGVDGKECYHFIHGAPLEVRVRYKINTPDLKERSQVLLAFHKDGVQDVMRVITRELLFDAGSSPTGVVTMKLPKNPLADGNYSVTVMLAKEGYYDKEQTMFFSVNPDVYTCVSRLFDIVVSGGGIVGSGTSVVSEADWSMDGETAPPTTDRLEIDFPACVQREFPESFDAAWSSINDIWATMKDADFASLVEKSPELEGYDWQTYLKCSVARMVRAVDSFHGFGVESGRLLDIGSYFGNFPLMFARAGYEAQALDSYDGYGESLSPAVNILKSEGVGILDFRETGYNLEEIPDDTYDAVSLMGVIEHIPHTPRLLLEGITRVLKPGGVLLIDTPNIAYIYNRQKLSKGVSPLASIESQFESTIPFEGHHREYTADEMVWMLKRVGHVDIKVTMYNYSLYGSSALTGVDLENYRAMLADPGQMELVMTASRKPGPDDQGAA